MMLQDLDVVATYGTCRLWPPKYLIRCPLYHQIRDYQRDMGYNDYGPTHVLLWIRGLFFEYTYPRAKWTIIRQADLSIKPHKVCRYKYADRLDVARVFAQCKEDDGTPYDVFDLLDFRISGWLGIPGVVRIFGDRANKFNVCSTGLLRALRAGGSPEPVHKAPAHFTNDHDWEIVADNTGGKHESTQLDHFGGGHASGFVAPEFTSTDTR